MPYFPPLGSGGVSSLSGLVSSFALISAPRLGQVATSCRMPTRFVNSNQQLMSRSPHTARDMITACKIVLPNWYWDRTGNQTEKGSGGTATFTASIEYPAGTFNQCRFAGATSAIVQNGADVTSDLVTLSTPIPAGSVFFVRIWFSNSAGIHFWQTCSVNGGGAAYGATTPDLTMSGTVPLTTTPTVNDGSQPGFGPTAILAFTSVPSVCLVGDSRVDGYQDVYDGTGDLGELARSVGASLPYINVGSFGDNLATYLASNAHRADLARYCTHVICESGINSITASGATLDGVRANLQALWRTFSSAGKPVFASTITPVTSSTDNWATVANQTAAASNPIRTALNDWIRSVPFYLNGYLEVADAVESARNSGLWKAGYTGDGTHETPTGYLAIKTAGGVSPTSFVR